MWFLALAFATCCTSSCAIADAEERAQAGVAGFARVQLPVQQCGAAGGVLRGAVGHAVPGAVGVGDGIQGHGGAAVLQSRQHSDWALPAVSDRHWPAAGVAQDLAGQPEAQLPVSGCHRAADRDCADGRRHEAVGGRILFLFADGDFAFGAGGATMAASSSAAGG